MIVYRIIICRTEDGKPGYYPIDNVDMKEEDYNQFRWDRINRLDNIQNNQVVFLANNKSDLEFFISGFCTAWELIPKWDAVFSLDNKLHFQNLVNKKEGRTPYEDNDEDKEINNQSKIFGKEFGNILDINKGE